MRGKLSGRRCRFPQATYRAYRRKIALSTKDVMEWVCALCQTGKLGSKEKSDGKMPLDFSFTEEQELFRKTIREFMAKNIAPKKKELLQARVMTPELHKAFTGMGLYGLLLPAEYGGSNSDYVTFLIAVEELTAWRPNSGYRLTSLVQRLLRTPDFRIREYST